MFLGYFIADTLNPTFCDVCQTHVPADVCLRSRSDPQHQVQTVTSTSKNNKVLHLFRLRQRSITVDVLRPETTSTRIPLLSP